MSGIKLKRGFDLMFEVTAKKIFTVEEPDLKVRFTIYLVSGKDELKGLINKFEVVCGLWNGENLYAWDAGSCDHTYVSGYLSGYEPTFKYNHYIGVTLDSDGLYRDYVTNELRQNLLNKFKRKFFKG